MRTISIENLRRGTAFTRYQSICKNFRVDPKLINDLINCGRVKEAVQLLRQTADVIEHAEEVMTQVINLPEPKRELPEIDFSMIKIKTPSTAYPYNTPIQAEYPTINLDLAPFQRFLFGITIDNNATGLTACELKHRAIEICNEKPHYNFAKWQITNGYQLNFQRKNQIEHKKINGEIRGFWCTQQQSGRVPNHVIDAIATCYQQVKDHAPANEHITPGEIIAIIDYHKWFTNKMSLTNLKWYLGNLMS